MSIWKEFKVGNIAKIENGFAFKSKDFSIEGVPIIKIKNVKPSLVNTNDLSYVPFEIASKLSKYKINKGDILITMSGNRIDGSPDSWVGKVATFNLEGTYLLNQRVSKVIVSSDDINPIYLSYVLSSIEYQQYFINEANSSGGQANISPETVRNTIFNAPDLPTQTAIAEILSSLDDKIELNNKINKELENLAQTLFKQWFIDFEFPNENGEPHKSSGGEMVDSELGEIPKGWGVKRLENLAKISLGGTPSRNNGGYWNGNIPWVNSGAINENYILSPTELITQEGLDNSSTKLIPKHSTLIAITGATLGQVSYSLIDACYNQSVISLTPPDNTKEFIHLLVNTIIQELIKHQTGGAQQHINKGNVETFKVIFPTEELLKRFKEILTDLYLKIECNLKENQQLTNLRDTLLPKLISGELEINELPN